jgi:hypothetical protein
MVITTEGKVMGWLLLAGAALAAFVLFVVGRLAWGDGWIYVALPGLWGSPWLLALIKLWVLLWIARLFIVAVWYGRRVGGGLLLAFGLMIYQMLEGMTQPPGPHLTVFELIILAIMASLLSGSGARGMTRAKEAQAAEKGQRKENHV